MAVEALKLEGEELESVVKRLRASRLEADTEMENEGISAGRDWAQHCATTAQLRRLDAHSKSSKEWPITDCSEVVYVVDGPDISVSAVDEFWDGDEGEMDHPDYIAGFCKGAMQVWDQVKGKI